MASKNTKSASNAPASGGKSRASSEPWDGIDDSPLPPAWVETVDVMCVKTRSGQVLSATYFG